MGIVHHLLLRLRLRLCESMLSDLAMLDEPICIRATAASPGSAGSWLTTSPNRVNSHMSALRNRRVTEHKFSELMLTACAERAESGQLIWQYAPANDAMEWGALKA
jgi:hypothetical protein